MKRGAIIVVLSSLLAALAACSSPDESAKVNSDVGLNSTSDGFPIFSGALVYKCGSLDCHGSTYRNMRLYGYGGLRKPKAGTAPDSVTIEQAELDANYQAVVGIEPEKTALVIAEGGREPERLALVAKPRGLQNHKGGPVTIAGDDMDKCLIAWLQKDVAAMKAACAAANKLGQN